MDISVELPLDSDGFIRRECPSCEQQFKWHYGPANEEAEGHPDATTYYCPLCGEPSGPDNWWTEEQLEFVQGFASPQIGQLVQDELVNAFSGASNSFVKFEVSSGNDIPDVPMSLTDPDDMYVVASPCHDFEPVKVPDELTGPFHCLMCGAVFAV